MFSSGIVELDKTAYRSPVDMVIEFQLGISGVMLFELGSIVANFHATIGQFNTFVFTENIYLELIIL